MEDKNVVRSLAALATPAMASLDSMAIQRELKDFGRR